MKKEEKGEEREKGTVDGGTGITRVRERVAMLDTMGGAR